MIVYLTKREIETILTGLMAGEHESLCSEVICDEIKQKIESADDFAVAHLRTEYAEKLADLSPEDQIKEMKQFMCDMMDWMQQTDCGDMYIKLHETLNE